MSLAQILAAARSEGGVHHYTIAEDWMQGRTTYGGLSSAIAFDAAQRIADDLPPLRTMQVSFIGPLGGEVTVRTELLRRGRTAAFVRADVFSEAGLGLSGVFVFMGDQPSHIDHVAMPAPAPFPSDPRPAAPVGPAPRFLQQFELIEADGARPGEWLRWVRLRERGGIDPIAELVAIADATPPGALTLATRPGPISSMTWLVNLLTSEPQTEDGWWLLRTTADYARNGCSSQSMAVWNSAGLPVASGMQSVALFV